jgi:hydroxypyruvate reductase
MNPPNRLLGSYDAALAAVHGRRVVRGALQGEPPPRAVHVLALGKAAEAMLEGAAETWSGAIVRALVVAPARKGSRGGPQAFPVSRAPGDHPVPGPRSLAAGQAMADFLGTVPVSDTLLVLLSGGTSSLVEMPCPGIDPEWLQRLNDRLLSSGWDIRRTNALRARLSRVKGGSALLFCGADDIRVLVLSDVPGDALESVGSGPFWPREMAADLPLDELGIPELRELLARCPAPPFVARPQHRLVAGNADARQAVVAQARSDGIPGYDHGWFPATSGVETASQVARYLRFAREGIHVWGGEAPVRLPPEPGRGGRAQHLAGLLLLLWNARGCPRPIEVLCAATDGMDGTSGAAGAWFDAAGGPLDNATRDALRAALRRADVAAFWESQGQVVPSAETGTNVTDLLIVRLGR